MMYWPAIVHKNRKRKQNILAFAPLFDKTGTDPIVLPANASLAVRLNSDVTEETVCVLVNGTKEISAPVMEANHIHNVGWYEKDVTVQVQNGFELLIDIGLGRWKTIGT